MAKGEKGIRRVGITGTKERKQEWPIKSKYDKRRGRQEGLVDMEKSMVWLI